MPILRIPIAAMLCASPLWAEEAAHVIGAQRAPHLAAPAAEGGDGDYGFSGGFIGPAQDLRPTPTAPAPDADLLAYEAEEALVEAEAALAAGEAGEIDIVID